MINKEIYIGCHLSTTEGYEMMGRKAIEIGANTFAFFTRNPRGGNAKVLDRKDAEGLRKILKANNFGKLVAHAPYTMNPCSSTEKVREFAYMAMKEDLERMEYFPGNYYNFHPGSHVGQGASAGIKMIADLLNNVMWEEQSTMVLLETMAGKGSEVGRNFEEIADIISGIKLKNKIGVCMDTCHINDGGYDIVHNRDEVLKEFDRIIGLDYLKALHINDSKNPMGSHKDRHAVIGEGTIGYEALYDFVHDSRLIGLPCILETPQDSLQGYAKEIKMLRE